MCEIVCQSKLSKFSVAMLKEICTALELNVYSITSKRKQPFVDILQRLVDKCSCKTMSIVIYRIGSVSKCPATMSDGGAFMKPPPVRAGNTQRGLGC